MGEHIVYLKCQHLKKALEIHELLFLWSRIDLSSPGCFLAVFTTGETWALLSTPYCSRPLRKRTVACGCKDVLAGSLWTQVLVWTSAGWKIPWSSACCSDVTWNCKRSDPALLSAVRTSSYTNREGNWTATFGNP